jgi:hypothetical protein
MAGHPIIALFGSNFNGYSMRVQSSFKIFFAHVLGGFAAQNMCKEEIIGGP